MEVGQVRVCLLERLRRRLAVAIRLGGVLPLVQ